MNVLDSPILSRVRRNHGLEHATINVLSEIYPYRPLAGYSYPGGFFIFGDVATEHLQEAATEALSRLNNGERHLAIHPNCGTNFVVAGFVTGVLVWLSLVGTRSRAQRVGRLPQSIVLATIGLMVSQALGPKVQERVTTSGYPQGLMIENVFPIRVGRLSVHQVVTKG